MTTTTATTGSTTTDSGEVRRLLADLYDAIATGDPRAWVSRLTPTSTGIGTDPAEFWSGDEQLSAVVTAQAQEMHAAGFAFRGGTPIIEVRGEVAFIVDQPTLVTGSGEVPMRLSVVLTADRDTWHVAHFHLSIGVPNEQMLHTTLTV
jgi:SnoaL-like domain